MECKICLDTYDEKDRRPRNLPCGHTFCSACIEDVIDKGALVCPNCRAQIPCATASSFPVAFELEELLGKLTALGLGSKGQNNDGEIEAAKDSEGKKVKEVIKKSEMMVNQLQQYGERMAGWAAEHTEFMKKMTILIEVNKTSRDLLTDEQQVLESLLQEGKEYQESLTLTSMSLLDSVSDLDAVVAVDEVAKSRTKMEDWLESCGELLPNSSIVLRSNKVRYDTNKALKTISPETWACDDGTVHVADDGDAVSIQVISYSPSAPPDPAMQLSYCPSAPPDPTMQLPVDIDVQLNSIIGNEPLTIQHSTGGRKPLPQIFGIENWPRSRNKAFLSFYKLMEKIKRKQ